MSIIEKVYIPNAIGGVTTILWVTAEKVIYEVQGVIADILYDIKQAVFALVQLKVATTVDKPSLALKVKLVTGDIVIY